MTVKIELIKSDIVEIITDLVQDWGVDLNGGLTGQTQLVADLEFASVDVIQLCVAIEHYYERTFAFQNLLMNDGKYISDLSINQMATYLQSKFIEGE